MPRGPRQSRFRNWVFTLNNWTQEEFDSLKTITCRWLIMGRECGENNTPHLQGAIVFTQPKTLTGVKKLPGFSRAHLEQMKGKPSDSRKYCTKEDTDFFENGEMPQQGKRNDLISICQELKAGKTIIDLAQQDEYASTLVRNYKGLIKYKSLVTPPRTEPPVVYWLHGPTGTNKTRSSVQLGNLAGSYWISSGSLQWFDGYEGQTVAILDDLRHQHCKFDYLLRLLDRYDMQVPFKGGFVKWTPKLICVTAPYSPERMWNLRDQGDINQLTRRITKVIDMSENKNSDLLIFKSLPWVSKDGSGSTGSESEDPKEMEETTDEGSSSINPDNSSFDIRC